MHSLSHFFKPFHDTLHNYYNAVVHQYVYEQGYMSPTEKEMEDFTNASLILMNNFDQSKKELTDLCDCLLANDNHATLGILLVNLCKKSSKISDTEAFEMMFDKFLGE